jgi:YHS domain-containing protein
MLAAMYTKEGKRTGAEEKGFFEALPLVGGGGATQSPARQKFVQAGSSLSEALLRAATGAGQNEAEARQKIEELTPNYFDEPGTIKQKLDAIPIYLQSLQARAGRASPKDYQVPTKPAPQFGVTVGGKTYYLPTQEAADTFKNSDAYKKAAGNK